MGGVRLLPYRLSMHPTVIYVSHILGVNRAMRTHWLRARVRRRSSEGMRRPQRSVDFSAPACEGGQEPALPESCEVT